MIFRSSSSHATEAFGCAMAKKILAQRPQQHALVLALRGDLGAGKTTLVRGFFRGLGLRARVLSPTFILMRRTTIRRKNFRNVFHVDAYRASARDFTAIGFRDILADPRNIVIIEWPERIRGLLPKIVMRLQCSHGRHEHERTIRTR